MATKLTDEQSRVLVGITTPAAQALANTTNKIPLVLGAVTSPKTSGLVKNERHPEKILLVYQMLLQLSNN